MQMQQDRMIGARPSRWRRAGFALLAGLTFAFGLSLDARVAAAAAPGKEDCVPAESPMGSARADIVRGPSAGSIAAPEARAPAPQSAPGPSPRGLRLVPA